MESTQIAVTATLLFFAGIIWGFVAIGLYVYRTNRNATLAVTIRNEAVFAGAAQAGSQRSTASLPEALPGPSSSQHRYPVLGNALIRDESLWKALQKDLIAVDVSGMGESASTETAVPAQAVIDCPSTEPDSTVSPSPSSPSSMVRHALHQGGFVIVDCCQIGKAEARSGKSCGCATASSSAVQSASPCAMAVSNHVKSPDTCFYVFRPSAAPYGESQYLGMPAISLDA
ncbi:hypothetical protein LSCM1_01544 [Leishmania martiniquensis]|uniref:Uncharacterized protein n=1 Tax=Leishmania martiniquensis TaxID=1580590 RepID=A0A836KI08_9TRYP|nr:hypothetical protein LSCM1_01544 [Leishmania martiniquensis]